MSPPALGLCLQYAPVFADRAAGVFAASRAETGVIPKRRSARFFALIGLFVNYFDLLTFPVVSLSFPLILLIALETKTTISFSAA